MSSLQELERAASDVLTILKTIRDFDDASIAVIGGLALWKYIPAGRTTKDVDFVISVQDAPKGVKEKLLGLENTPFIEQAQFFFYKSPAGSHVQIDIVPSWQGAFMPSSAVKLRDLPTGVVPFTSVADLTLLKIHACGLRAQLAKSRTDAMDAEALLALATAGGPLALTSHQQDQVEPCIADVVKHGKKDEAWWRQRLGLPARG